MDANLKWILMGMGFKNSKKKSKISKKIHVVPKDLPELNLKIQVAFKIGT